MLNKYKNDILTAIKGSGFAPSCFTTYEDGDDFCITLTGTEIHFLFFSVPESYHMFRFRYVPFCPGNKQVLSDDFSPHPNEDTFIFRTAMEQFRVWLKSIRDYFEDNQTPDLWAELQKQNTITDLTGQADDQYTPFTVEQKRQIRLGLNEVRLLIQKEFEPSEDEMNVVTNRLDYLADALDRLNKFDWKSVLMGTIISVSTALAFSPEQADSLYQIFKNMLAGIVPLIK